MLKKKKKKVSVHTPQRNIVNFTCSQQFLFSDLKHFVFVYDSCNCAKCEYRSSLLRLNELQMTCEAHKCSRPTQT